MNSFMVLVSFSCYLEFIKEFVGGRIVLVSFSCYNDKNYS